MTVELMEDRNGDLVKYEDAKGPKYFCFKVKTCSEEAPDIILIPESKIETIRAFYGGRNQKFSVNGYAVQASLDEFLKHINVVNLSGMAL